MVPASEGLKDNIVSFGTSKIVVALSGLTSGIRHLMHDHTGSDNDLLGDIFTAATIHKKTRVDISQLVPM